MHRNCISCHDEVAYPLSPADVFAAGIYMPYIHEHTMDTIAYHTYNSYMRPA